jgi:hypothetical protein
VFAPVEIRNPASPSSTLRPTSKAKTPGKESGSNPKKGKKKVNVGAGGIEEVAGSLSVGVSKSSVSVDRDPAAESGPSTRGKAAGRGKDNVAQDDGDDDMYATEEDDGAGEGGGDGILEGNVGGGGEVGEEGADTSAGLLPRKKRKPSRKDANKGKGSGNRSIQGTTTTTAISTPTPARVSDQNTVEGTVPTGSGIPMAIDPALEALQVPSNQSPTQAPGSGAAI